MSRFYVPREAVQGNSMMITGDEAHHIRDVMRLKVSDEVVAFDGTGREYTGVITQITPRSVSVVIVRTSEPKYAERFASTLIQAIPKKEKMDYIVEKATELGVKRIIPVITQRTIVDWDLKKKDAAVGRWRRISLAAAKQCGRLDIPEISAVTDFSGLLKERTGYGLAMIAALCGGSIGLKEALKGFKSGDAAIAIGPEGDWTPEEIEASRAAGYKPVSLGRRVLRSDTAGLAVLSILNYELSS